MELKFKVVIWAALSAGSFLHASVVAKATQLNAEDQAELAKIDQELEQLEDLKNRYRASAARYEDQALRWQFEQNLKQEARRSAQKADLDREMERQIQQRIDFLQARRAELLNE